MTKPNPGFRNGGPNPVGRIATIAKGSFWPEPVS